MAKNHKWEGSKITYGVPGAGEAALDIAALPDAVKAAALAFGIQTAMRNATAGLFKEEPLTALKRIQARVASWLSGEWKAAATGEGERKTSMLAQAVAEAGEITVEEAASIISDMIESKVSEAGLDGDDDEDKPTIRKIAQAVRDSFEEAEGVAVILARIKAQAAQARAEEAAKVAEKAKAEGKQGKSLKELLGK
jgi:hypothetical protein